ncbi:MAG: type II toxin-antitoxin system PemK/MazF family toxin [Patescibacteria group bacterium]
MKKDFDGWNEHKKIANNSEFSLYFYEREIWWCAVGVNIGFEQDGKGIKFARPVLVLKKYSKNVFVGVPLTTAKRESKYHHSFPFLDGVSTALLSQVRLFDSRRLLVKMGRISKDQYEEIRKRIKSIL